MSVLYQVGLVPAFLNGVYVSDYNFKKLARHGDFGLGTINELNGEMIGLDGIFYCIDEHGKAREISAQECTPFSVVSFYKPYKMQTIQHVENLQQLNQILLKFIENINLFYMIRIDGLFSSMKLRSETCHCTQDKPLAEVLDEYQKKYVLHKTQGCLVVTYSPAYANQICIPSFHYHYINEQRSTGGHVFDLRVERASIGLQAIENFQLHLVNLPKLSHTNLILNIADELKKIE